MFMLKIDTSNLNYSSLQFTFYLISTLDPYLNKKVKIVCWISVCQTSLGDIRIFLQYSLQIWTNFVWVLLEKMCSERVALFELVLAKRALVSCPGHIRNR